MQKLVVLVQRHGPTIQKVQKTVDERIRQRTVQEITDVRNVQHQIAEVVKVSFPRAEVSERGETQIVEVSVPQIQEQIADR